MVHNFPSIYKDELLYSFLARIFVDSGIGSASKFWKEIFNGPNDSVNHCFVNKFNNEFRVSLEKSIGIRNVILKHTMFSYYSRFLTGSEKKKAYEALRNMAGTYNKFLPIPINKKNYYLRYCPICVMEDRKKHGECYFHLSHQIYNNHYCSKHKCKLIDTDVSIDSKTKIMVSLENCDLSRKVIQVSKENINYRISKYIQDVLDIEVDFEDYSRIGSFLISNLDDKYFSTRGEQKDIDRLYKDLCEFYKDLDDFSLTKGRVKTIFTNENKNVFDIFLIAFYEGIKPGDLAKHKTFKEKREDVFDLKVNELHGKGLNMLQISKLMKCDKEIIRQVLLGTYKREKNPKCRNRNKRKNWNKVDCYCCEHLDEIIKKVLRKNPNTLITKALVAREFKLKDKSLRNLPMLKSKIRKFKLQSL